MPGNYLLDTNVIIYAINQRLTIPAGCYGISIITEMELLSFPRITAQEENQIHLLCREFELLGISESIKKMAIDIRRKTALKLPDSIISATALEHHFMLVTNDEKLAEHHPGVAMSLEELMN
ncbi:type II toxin-antitoxin system VapC family toxin [Halomonas sp. HK25]|uniref:type II toxin-antitoxin system VapC family toxin n=1 Tax=Halomonas sp. HK25 TaxID=3394321 RepID=UPI0039FC5B07